MNYTAKAYHFNLFIAALDPNYQASCIKTITTRWHWRARLFKFAWAGANVSGYTWATIEARDEAGIPEELLQ